MAGLERPGEYAQSILFVEDHFEVVPLSQLGAACGIVLFPHEGSGRFSWGCLSDFSLLPGERTKLFQAKIVDFIFL